MQLLDLARFDNISLKMELFDIMQRKSNTAVFIKNMEIHRGWKPPHLPFSGKLPAIDRVNLKFEFE